MLKTVTWQDEAGRRWRSLLPPEADDAEAPAGIPAGPPSLNQLNLPLEISVRLHNELEARGLYTWDDVRRQGRTAVQAAVAAALRLDVELVQACYAEQLQPADPAPEPTPAPVTPLAVTNANGTRRAAVTAGSALPERRGALQT